MLKKDMNFILRTVYGSDLRWVLTQIAEEFIALHVPSSTHSEQDSFIAFDLFSETNCLEGL